MSRSLPRRASALLLVPVWALSGFVLVGASSELARAESSSAAPSGATCKREVADRFDTCKRAAGSDGARLAACRSERAVMRKGVSALQGALKAASRARKAQVREAMRACKSRPARNAMRRKFRAAMRTWDRAAKAHLDQCAMDPGAPPAVANCALTDDDCALCGAKAYGFCPKRHKYVCEEHRVFEQGGVTWICPG